VKRLPSPHCYRAGALCDRFGDPIGLFELVAQLLVTFGPFDESLFVEVHQ
jgi:hypothetical protein